MLPTVQRISINMVPGMLKAHKEHIPSLLSPNVCALKTTIVLNKSGINLIAWSWLRLLVQPMQLSSMAVYGSILK